MSKLEGIVGIGASAGGLEALQKVLSNLQSIHPLGYVVAQHLSPTHTSMLRELLSRATSMVVKEILDGQEPESGTIFITPPNTDVELEGGCLRLFQTEHAIGPKPSVDRLFFSLAKQLGPRAIGIILSGTGSDGAKGLSAIKKAGGLALVQEPRSAKYSGMPNAALHRTTVDYIAPAEEIGEILDAHLKGEKYRTVRDEEALLSDEIREIIQVVHEHAGIDLSGYKLSMLSRRLQRRQAALRLPGLSAYIAYLREHFDEASLLSREVLISVTRFFRDSHAFTVLREALCEVAVRAANEGDEVRIWNPGCATGEETYSLATILEELMAEQRRPVGYKIFATDIDAKAIFTGRQGIYGKKACDVLPEEWLARYFDVQGDTACAKKTLRNNIVFSIHNLTQDPPFSKMDLIVCRNVLIYFNNTLQKRLLSIFNHALNPEGLLFLGKSESIGLHKDLFVDIDKGTRIFKKRNGFSLSRYVAMEFDGASRLHEPPAPRRKTQERTLNETINQLLTEAYAPPVLTINQNDEVVYIHGDATPFIGMKSGRTALNLFSLINEQFRTELRALVYKCRRENQPVVGSRRSVSLSTGETPFRLSVRPVGKINGLGESGIVLVAFEPVHETIEARSREKTGSEETSDNQSRLAELEEELVMTQEHLRTVIEELETSNEELQSITEELQSSNEELQATNEELQTANEELQSTNEELMTVNDELQLKSHELEKALTDLQNVLISTEYPLLVVDGTLRVTRYVPAVEQLLDKEYLHLGDTITSLSWKMELNDLRGILKEVMEKHHTYSDTVQCNGKYYRFIVRPYRLDDNQVMGAVLWFPEVTDLTLANIYLKRSKERLRAILGSVLVGVITIDDRGVIQEFNQTAEVMFGYSGHEVIGQPIEILMPPEHARNHHQYLRNYLQKGVRNIIGQVRELEGLRKDGSRFPMELSVSELFDGERRLFCGVMADITRRKEAEKQLSNEQSRALVTLESINDAVISVDGQLKVQYMNSVAAELSGWSNNVAVGHLLTEVYQVCEEKTHLPIETRLINQVQNGERVRLLDGIVLKSLDGQEYSIEHSVAPVFNEAGEMTGSVLSFRDITAKRKLLQQMTWQAQHDPLTGLVNRSEFERRVNHALASAKSFGRRHALLYMDLDQFKVVNDTCGHHAGDELLRRLAGILASALRRRDTLARMGGDEFAVLLENCSLNNAEQIAEKLHQLVQEFRFTHDDKLFKVGISVGIVPITENSENLAALLSNADAACYAAKETGRNRVVTHSANDVALEFKRAEMHWVNRIEKAIDENRFQLYFQQIRPIKDGDHNRWEVLLRMEENGNMVLPGAFIPAAERFGQVQSLDRWVLTRVVDELNNHSSNGGPVVAINLSGSSIINPKFCAYAVSLVKQHLNVARRLCFEITETTAIANFSMAHDFMRSMKRLGCLFALDDFGSGMSSFGYLKNLPVDYLKIDGIFVKDILHDPIDLFMVESINRIGQIMNIKTIAEFAETDAIVEKLRQIGVDYAQGFAIGRPISLEEFLTRSGDQRSDERRH